MRMRLWQQWTELCLLLMLTLYMTRIASACTRKELCPVYLHPPVPMMHATSDQEITITGLIEGNSSQNTSPHWLIQVAHRTYTPLALHQEFANEGVTASESPLTLSSSRKQAMLMLGGLLPEWRYVAVMLWASSGCHCETGHTTRVTIIEISPASTEEPQIPSNPETPRKPSVTDKIEGVTSDLPTSQCREDANEAILIPATVAALAVGSILGLAAGLLVQYVLCQRKNT